MLRVIGGDSRIVAVGSAKRGLKWLSTKLSCGYPCGRRLHSTNSARAGWPRASAELVIGRHVREALANGEPIVALESTVITHGLPEPQNLELALGLERILADNVDHQQLGDNRGQKRQLQGEDDNNASNNNINLDERLPTAQSSQQQQQHPSDDRPLTAGQAKVAAVAAKVTPATIGIVKGQIVVGLSGEEIEYLSRRQLSNPIKASRRDIPIAMALGLSAGTTVAATMAIACSLGARTKSGHSSSPIKVFATGGMGGVHLGGESSMDISADLYEFARSPIGVVSSGFKSFLDTRRSLEFLETMGCTVMSLRRQREQQRGSSASHRNSINDDGDQSDDHLFPGFFSPTNRQGVKSPWLVNNTDEAARILYHCLEGPLANRRASLLAVPIPAAFGLEGDDETLERAMAEVARIDERQDLVGREKTPLILEHLNRATGGKSLRANIELLKNNAKVGGQLALKYAALSSSTGAILRQESSGIDSSSSSPGGRQVEAEAFKERPGESGSGPTRRPELSSSAYLTSSQQHAAAAAAAELGGSTTTRTEAGGSHGTTASSRCVVVGCTMIDMHVYTKIDDHFKNNPQHSGVTFEGRPHLALGGVGRNLATGIEFLGHQPTFITALARDNLGSFAWSELRRSGLPAHRLRVNWLEGDSSGSCFALVLMDSIGGQCEYVVANLEAARAINTQLIERNADQIGAARLVVMDANLPEETIVGLLELCHRRQVRVFIEPTDVVVLPRLVHCLRQLKTGPTTNSRDNADDKQATPTKSKSSSSCLQALLCLSPNVIELQRMLELFDAGNDNDDKSQPIDGPPAAPAEMSLQQIDSMARRFMRDHVPQLKCLLVTLDKRGVLVAVRSTAADIGRIRLMDDADADDNDGDPSKEHLLIKHFEPPHPIERPVSASGAGDSFASGFIGGLLNDSSIAECLANGFRASMLTLQDKDTISLKLKTLGRHRSYGDDDDNDGRGEKPVLE